MQPNQNTAGMPNRNITGVGAGVGAGGARPRPGMAGASSQSVVGGVPASALGRSPRPARVAPRTVPVNAAASMSAGATASEAKNEPAVEQNMMANGVNGKKKGKSGMILGMVLLAILAAGGIGFGVWAMMDGNTQTAKKDELIKDLKQQNSTLQEQLGSADAMSDDLLASYNNPVISSSNSDEAYMIGLKSSPVDGKSVRINVKDGKVESCNIVAYSDESLVSECMIDGIEGNIFNVVEFGEGQDNLASNIGFIMTDGTVLYLPLAEAINSNTFAIKGKLNVNGFITNAVTISTSSTNPDTPGGVGSTIFILSDGSIVRYSESMLN